MAIIGAVSASEQNKESQEDQPFSADDVLEFGPEIEM